MTSTRERGTHRIGTVLTTLGIGVVLAACSSSPPTSSSTSSSTTIRAVSPGASPTAPPPNAIASITAAITAYQAAQGVNRADYSLSGVKVSSADASWAYFHAVPTAAGEATPPGYQGGFGILHETNGDWEVTDFGTAGEGCGTAADNPAVPPAVLSSFGLTCPG